ncbi:MAG: NigD-like protein [bacterium]|nr:NigD-like protein [bacterium]
MKMWKSFSWVLGLCLTLSLFTSCLDDDDYSLGNFSMGVASVKAPNGSAPYFRLDDGTTLWPAAGYLPGSLKDNQRVWMNFTLLGDSAMGAVGYDYYIRVNRLDEVLTKTPVEHLGAAANDSIYGTDPVKILGMWTGNGFLTIHFGANFGGQERHWINLVNSADQDKPYELEFRQNAYNDSPMYSSQSLVCFDLRSLPVADEKVTLSIRVHTFEGEKVYEVAYDTKGLEAGGEMKLNETEISSNQVK